MASKNITKEKNFNGPTQLSGRECRLLRKMIDGDFLYSLAVAPSADLPGVFYIFRPSGAEISVELKDGKILHSSHELSDFETKYIQKNLIARKNTFIL